MARTGTDYVGTGAYDGNINADNGAVLISRDSAESISSIAGPALNQEIIAGVANGNFQIPPNDDTLAIAADNILPYFSVSDSSSGRIAATIVDSAASPGSNRLRYTITSGVNTDSLYLERIIPVATSEARSFNYQIHAAVASATSSANYTFSIVTQYLTADGTTTTGTSNTASATGASLATSISTLGFGYELFVDANGGAPAPADAVYLRSRFTVTCTGSVSNATLELAEVRADRGFQEVMLSDQSKPDTYGYSSIAMNNGALFMEPNAVGADRANPTFTLDSQTGDSQIDSSIRTSNPVTITNALQSYTTAIYTAANSYAVGDIVTVSSVTPSGFNLSGAVTAASSTSFSLGGMTAGTPTSATNFVGRTTSVTNVFPGILEYEPSSTTGFSVGDNVAIINYSDTRLNFGRGEITANDGVRLWIRNPNASWQVTAGTFISGTSASFTIPGHTLVIGNVARVSKVTNAVASANLTVSAVSGNVVTFTAAAATFTNPFTITADSAMRISTNALTGNIYKNSTIYTSGGTAKASYPLTGNVYLVASGNSGSVIVKQGFVGNNPSTVADLRFISTTGPRIQGGGTNARAMLTNGSDFGGSTSSTTAGVLLTKATAGQPTTNINGTGTTDAFADALRNGGLAVDTTNNRAYFYSAGWKYAALTTPSDSRLKEEITAISGALDTLRQLVPVAFKWKRPEAHGRAESVEDNGQRLGFIADQVATTDLKHWVETLGVDEREADLVDTEDVLAVNIPQNEMEALVVQALLDIDARLKALEGA
jgi:hypothetical protein